MKKAAISLFIIAALAYCKTTGTTITQTTPKTEDQKKEQESLDRDPFLTAKPEPGEVFRVLITKDGYYVKQVAFEEGIRRKVDATGDDEQLQQFQKFNEKYDFRDFSITGTLRVRLNPVTGDIEKIDFEQNPVTWQAGQMFQDDVSRFSFEFPQKVVQPTNMRVRYEWRIKRRAGLSDDEAKRRALEFLKSQVR